MFKDTHLVEFMRLVFNACQVTVTVGNSVTVSFVSV